MHTREPGALTLLRFPQPERINPETNQKGYNVKSDIWSLGITMVTKDKPFSSFFLAPHNLISM